MAIVWETSDGGHHYQVRTAGQSVRLYKDGVFHSQWNSRRPLSGGVWDLLFLPSLFLPEDSVKRVLLLGVGGGAVIQQYLTFHSPDHVVGVELDPVHIQVAREHFGVCQPNVELITADALEWVKSYRGPGFDIVIEDLFTEKNGEPVRVAAATTEWFAGLRRLMRPHGVLIINFEDPAQMRASGPAYLESIGNELDNRYGLTLPAYGNSVAAFLAIDARPAELRKRLNNLLEAHPASARSAQKFRIRKISAK